MNAEERRKEIVNLLYASTDALSGSVLAEKLGISRQIIVQDIALLKAEGFDILSTHKGYIIKDSPLIEKVFKLRHTSDQTLDELSSVVSLGGCIVDVFVNHKVYGRIKAMLNIASQNDVEIFRQNIESGKSSELMHVTSGYHYHTVRAENETVLLKIEEMLMLKGYLVE